MADILSQEEIDALLSATEADEGSGDGAADLPPPAAPRRRVVTTFDFRHPARVSKDQLRTLENVHDEFARLLSVSFSDAMRAVVSVDTAFVDQTTYSELIMALSNPACSCRFGLSPLQGAFLLDVSMPVVFALVDRTFGGKGSSQGVDARQLTRVEHSLMDDLLRRALADLEATWEPLAPLQVTDLELVTNPEFLEVCPAGEVVVVLAFEVNSTNASGLISLCYPYFALEPLLAQLRPRHGAGNEADPRAVDGLRQSNRARLGRLPLPVRVDLARGRCTLGEAQGLEAGDVLLTHTRLDEPVVVHVGDEPAYLAAPFVGDDGRLKLKIVDEIPPDRRQAYR